MSGRLRTPPTGSTFVDVVRPGRGLVTGPKGAFTGGIVRDGTDYIVEEGESGQVIGRARSYRSGADRLARHYGYAPSPVEITHEWKEFGL